MHTSSKLPSHIIAWQGQGTSANSKPLWFRVFYFSVDGMMRCPAQVTRSHRLDDSAAERERVLAAGAEVAQSEVDGKPVGPLRVWPGGLAMSRTIGDHEAGPTCSCKPDVRQVPALAPTCLSLATHHS